MQLSFLKIHPHEVIIGMPVDFDELIKRSFYKKSIPGTSYEKVEELVYVISSQTVWHPDLLTEVMPHAICEVITYHIPDKRFSNSWASIHYRFINSRNEHLVFEVEYQYASNSFRVFNDKYNLVSFVPQERIDQNEGVIKKSDHNLFKGVRIDYERVKSIITKSLKEQKLLA